MKTLIQIPVLVFCLSGIATSVFAADPCNEVMSGASGSLRATIRDLAKLRFDLDQSLIRGEENAWTRALKDQYALKEAEVLAASKMEREELLSALKIEIEKIQSGAVFEEENIIQSKQELQHELEKNNARLLPLGTLQHRNGHPLASVLPDSRILIAGGFDGNNFLDTIEIIDPSTGESKVVGHLKQRRFRHSQVVLPDGRVVISGGFCNEGYLGSVEIFDPKTGESQTIGNLKSQRTHHSQLVLSNEKILILGGEFALGGKLHLSEIFDLKTGVSEVNAPLIKARSDTQTVLSNDQVLITGKLNNQTAIEIYNPQTNTSQRLGQLLIPRFDYAQSLLLDGRVLVSGGQRENEWVSEIEAIDPKTGTSEIIGKLVVPRKSHTQTVLPDGRVLIVGGNGVSWVTSIEVFDPETGVSEEVGFLGEPRENHAVVKLPDGKVVLIGGVDISQDARVLNSVNLIKVGHK